MQEQLKNWGCNIDLVSNGQDALKKLKQAVKNKNPFDVAILDMMMPEMDGETLGKLIKADSEIADTIIIMLTSVTERGDALRLKNIGFAAYLTKPIKQSQLYNSLATVVGKKILKSDKKTADFVTKKVEEDIKQDILKKVEGIRDG